MWEPQLTSPPSLQDRPFPLRWPWSLLMLSTCSSRSQPPCRQDWHQIASRLILSCLNTQHCPQPKWPVCSSLACRLLTCNTRGMLPTGFWNSDGFTGICHNGKSRDGRCWRTSICHLPNGRNTMALWCDHIKQFHQHVNSMEAFIQFLDTKIIQHEDGSLSIIIFHKQTRTDRYLDFSSHHHPLTHKTVVVQTLLARADQICTSFTDKDAERVLSSNGYPKAAVDRIRPPTFLPTLPRHEQERPNAVVTLPYIRHLSESICRILTPLCIRTCILPHQTLRWMLAHLKYRVEPEHQAGVVYRIPCRTFTKVYISQTGYTLEHRLKEYRKALC